ncbi:undecaprenyl-phosphate alpha-N-acetylglucosaminyl 1-phosphate transferase [Candidatus Levyibacteriota bacterium]|nr:undecaprenyl/decaprenyl-phosphate alpha-N-acetylglucosaminyl 1-phosphate transferase [Candidatus Levybacteria bacterium]GDX62313.1 undecaprenyl-phosphate alpha-N-acetylglucosaminyl 1-phosphate transferase [Candidatus Levybacteria bacterium]
MINNYIFVILPFIVALITTIIATPISLIFIRKLKLIDDPAKHKHPAIIHTKPIPRGGGIPLFIGIIVASLFFLPFSLTTIALYIASFISLSIGVVDDKFDISPYFRFFINIITAIIVVTNGVSIAFITNPLGGILHLNTIVNFFGFPILSIIISVLWIVWIMNMLNWSKGVDGQMPGIVAISAIIIGILSLRFSDMDTNSLIATKLSFIIAGASIGFLPFNFFPAKIFPGYGATSIYILLAAVSILSGAKLATAILVMGIPMVDGIFTIGRRIISGQSPFKHDKKHLHHLLLRLGFTQPKIALFYWAISAILGTISLMLSSQGKIFAIIMLITVVGGILLFLHKVSNYE